MEINRVDPLYPRRPRLTPPDARRPGADAPADRVTLSPQARLREQLRGGPDIRTDRVDALRRAIQSGRYDEERLLPHAIDRLLEEL